MSDISCKIKRLEIKYQVWKSSIKFGNQVSSLASRETERQAGRDTGKLAGRQAGRHKGREADMQEVRD